MARRTLKLPKIQTVIGDIGWHEANRDPDLWHIIAKEANFDLETTRNFVEWVIGQPDCDRATAAFLFPNMDGANTVATLSNAEGRRAMFSERLITRICVR
jgi:hypothetical protein